MPGETDLRALLAGMTPTLRPEVYVFWTLPPGERLPDGVTTFATVSEDEGLTAIIERRFLSSGTADDEAFRAITLGVHSSLDAVGFIAAVSRALADAGIAANVIAGYHHDHVLVRSAQAEHALAVLRKVGILDGRPSPGLFSQ